MHFHEPTQNRFTTTKSQEKPSLLLWNFGRDYGLHFFSKKCKENIIV